MIMAVGAFGVISVHAQAEEEISFGPGAQGWAGAVTIAEDVAAAGGVDSAVIVWEAFLCAGHRIPDCTVCAGNAASFIKLYDTVTTPEHALANVQWEAWWALSNTDISITNPVVIKPNQAQAANTSGSYLEISRISDRTDVKLVITQVKGQERYGWVRVRLTVTVAGGTPATATSADIWVQLRDPSKLANLLLKADAELLKTDRYTKAYINNLRIVTDAAKLDIKKKITQAELDAWVDVVQKAIDGKKSDGTSVGKRWKVNTWGWDWWDNLWPDSFCKVWWSFKDFFNPFIGFLGQVGKALGFLLPLFGMLGGLLGL